MQCSCGGTHVECDFNFAPFFVQQRLEGLQVPVFNFLSLHVCSCRVLEKVLSRSHQQEHSTIFIY